MKLFVSIQFTNSFLTEIPNIPVFIQLFGFEESISEL